MLQGWQRRHAPLLPVLTRLPLLHNEGVCCRHKTHWEDAEEAFTGRRCSHRELEVLLFCFILRGLELIVRLKLLFRGGPYMRAAQIVQYIGRGCAVRLATAIPGIFNAEPGKMFKCRCLVAASARPTVWAGIIFEITRSWNTMNFVGAWGRRGDIPSLGIRHRPEGAHASGVPVHTH